jgi:hypothetical protein
MFLVDDDPGDRNPVTAGAQSGYRYDFATGRMVPVPVDPARPTARPTTPELLAPAAKAPLPLLGIACECGLIFTDCDLAFWHFTACSGERDNGGGYSVKARRRR